MNIYDGIWVITSPNKRNDPELAYMTHRSPGLKKRQTTGRRWARGYDTKQTALESDYDNEFLEGFQLGEVVGRYSTSNKLFRVRDPRGFVVEVPTANVQTLISCSTIVKGTVQGKCLWGSNSSGHFLIHEDSDEYREAFAKKLKKNTKTVTPSKVEPGAVLKDGYDQKYLYVGRYDMEVGLKASNAESQKNGQDSVTKSSSIDLKGHYVLLPIYEDRDPGKPEIKKTFKMVLVSQNELTEDERETYEELIIEDTDSYPQNLKSIREALDKLVEESRADFAKLIPRLGGSYWGWRYSYFTKSMSVNSLKRVK